MSKKETKKTSSTPDIDEVNRQIRILLKLGYSWDAEEEKLVENLQPKVAIIRDEKYTDGFYVRANRGDGHANKLLKELGGEFYNLRKAWWFKNKKIETIREKFDIVTEIEGKPKTGIQIKIKDDYIFVSGGSTFNHKSELGKLGVWNSLHQAWKIPNTKKNLAIVKKLETKSNDSDEESADDNIQDKQKKTKDEDTDDSDSSISDEESSSSDTEKEKKKKKKKTVPDTKNAKGRVTKTSTSRIGKKTTTSTAKPRARANKAHDSDESSESLPKPKKSVAPAPFSKKNVKPQKKKAEISDSDSESD